MSESEYDIRAQIRNYKDRDNDDLEEAGFNENYEDKEDIEACRNKDCKEENEDCKNMEDNGNNNGNNNGDNEEGEEFISQKETQDLWEFLMNQRKKRKEKEQQMS